MKNHEIIIDNFKSNETVHYPLIIIKGHIENSEEATCDSSKIELTYQNTSFKLAGSNFKALLELKEGANTIELKYCCESLSISLVYEQKSAIYSVLPLYIICQGHNGSFQAPESEDNSYTSALIKINLCAKLLQSLLAEKLNEANFGRKTFKLKQSRVFYSRLDYLRARKLSRIDLWHILRRELAYSAMNQSGNVKFLGFISCTEYCGADYDEETMKTHDDLVKITKAYGGMGGGGLALFGSASFFTWPNNIAEVEGKFENKLQIDRRQFLDDSCYRGTWGACFTTTLGSVLHELCHCFDLGHTAGGVMGRGFDNIHKVFLSNAEERGSSLMRNYQANVQFEGATVLKINKRLDEDGTFWTRSCLILLAYHKWLNHHQTDPDKKIRFERTNRVVSSTNGLRVVELRNEEDEMVLKFWTFESRIRKFFFQIPPIDHSVLLVVEDSIGNIFKTYLDIL